MRRKSKTLFCLYLVCSSHSAWGQQRHDALVADVAMAGFHYQASSANGIVYQFVAGIRPLEVFMENEDPQTGMSKHRSGDGYILTRAHTSKPHDSLLQKNMLYAIFKPVFQKRLPGHTFIFAAPQTGIYLGAYRVNSWRLRMCNLPLVAETAAPWQGMRAQTGLGAECGAGWQPGAGAVLQLSGVQEVIYDFKGVTVMQPCALLSLCISIRR